MVHNDSCKKNKKSKTAHETLDWILGDRGGFRVPLGDCGCGLYKAKLTKKRSKWSRDSSQQYFFVNVVFFGVSSPALVAARVACFS